MSEKNFPPRLWICWKPKSEMIATAMLGGDDFSAPGMLPPCSNQDLPYWFRAISYVEHRALLAELERKLAVAEQALIFYQFHSWDGVKSPAFVFDKGGRAREALAEIRGEK